MESSSSSLSLSLSSSSTRKAKATGCVNVPVAAPPHCLVDGCDADLSLCRDYHRRHKVCEMHSKTPKVTIGGREQRFCQQCSRFHSLVEFDEGKRSCRKRLDGHNRRRRKPQPMDSSLISGRNSGGPIFSTSSQHSIASAGGAGFLSFATSATSYPLPQILPSAAAVSSSWGAALKSPQNNKDTNTGLIYQSHHQFNNNFTERQSNSPFHQVEFMQQNNTTEAAATSSSVFSSDEGLHHNNCNHQVVDDPSDRALSLLSSAPRSQVGVVTATTAKDFGLNHNNGVVQPVVQQSLEINNHNLQQCFCNLSAGVQYHPFTHDGETKPPIVDSAGDSTLHFPGMFHHEPDEASSHATGESPHQTLKFIWE